MKMECLDEHVSPEGHRYQMGMSGTIHQMEAVPINYTASYVADRYLPRTIPPETLAALAHLRLGYVIGQCMPSGDRMVGKRILDWGYGAGAFIKAAANYSHFRAYGYDISGWPAPQGVTPLAGPPAGIDGKWHVVTFHDVLEHIPNLDFLRTLDTEWLVITVPWCHAHDIGLEWFWQWKHRRPNEHLHHWNLQALSLTLADSGFSLTHWSDLEDTVRGRLGAMPNILTVTARRA